MRATASPTGKAKRSKARSEDGNRDPLWYVDAIIYEVHIRAFSDGNADGIGDFAGLTSKLDYLQELGVNTLWLLPFYVSPLRDDGYDIADYRRIHPDYGTMRDFRRFLAAAHARGLRVITELVLNHTSDQHAWFQRSREAPKGSTARDRYVWSDTASEFAGTRIIFTDSERSNWTWDPVAGAYYWHRFYSHQPDLNFDNPKVRAEMLEVVDFWLDEGVDGLRLDAVPYLFEREGTTCENLPETHQFLKELRQHVDSRFPGRILIGEANQWPEDAAQYFGAGDECHMLFHFPLMPRLFMAIRMEDAFPIIDILDVTPAPPAGGRWAVFLRNHDELTLEMVTDEERDHMYRAYAEDRRARINVGIRRRLAPLLGGDRRRLELMNAILFSLEGTPVIYYGDEIGMGDNIYLGDRDSVRTPMQWSADTNAGFSQANPQKMYLPVNVGSQYHYEALNVQTQQARGSLLDWTKRIIALRRRHRALSRGSMQMVTTDNRKVLAFVREYEGERVLVVANLARFVQAVHLNLQAYAGTEPLELFGQAHFPMITDAPYFLSLGPQTFFWFSLRRHGAGAAVTLPGHIAGGERPRLAARDWESVFSRAHAGEAEALLLAYMRGQRWFRGKSRAVRRATITGVIPVGGKPALALYVIVQFEYVHGEADEYGMFVTGVGEERASELTHAAPSAIIADVVVPGGVVTLIDALVLPEVARKLLSYFRGRRSFPSDGRSMNIRPLKRLPRDAESWTPRVHRGEQTNTSVMYADQLMLKLVRRIEPGINQQVELERFISGTSFAPHAPQIMGTIELDSPRGGSSSTVAILETQVTHQTDGWIFALDELTTFLEAVAHGPAPTADARQEGPFAEHAALWIDLAGVLGQRTAEMHIALASARAADPDLTPEPHTSFSRQAMAHNLRSRVRETFSLLRAAAPALEGPARGLAEQVLHEEATIKRRLASGARRPFPGLRIRCHGDYHLSQILVNGRDVVVIDFEGEPGRTLGDRRAKRSPLYDVAGMIRSFHYVRVHGVGALVESARMPNVPREQIEAWARLWQAWSAREFLRAYVAAIAGTGILSDEPEEMMVTLGVLVMEKALYEVAYEIDNRPAWVHLPLEGILDCLHDPHYLGNADPPA